MVADTFVSKLPGLSLHILWWGSLSWSWGNYLPLWAKWSCGEHVITTKRLQHTSCELMWSCDEHVITTKRLQHTGCELMWSCGEHVITTKRLQHTSCELSAWSLRRARYNNKEVTTHRLWAKWSCGEHVITTKRLVVSLTMIKHIHSHIQVTSFQAILQSTLNILAILRLQGSSYLGFNSNFTASKLQNQF